MCRKPFRPMPAPASSRARTYRRETRRAAWPTREPEAAAAAAALDAELALRHLQLRRIDAELRGARLTRADADPEPAYAQVEAQREARVQAYENSLAEERAVTARARREMQAAQETKLKLS